MAKKTKMTKKAKKASTIKKPQKAKKKRSTKKIVFITAGVLLAVLAILFAALYVYSLDYYRADESVAAKYDTEAYQSDSVRNAYVFYPEADADTGTGLIFYPGGKVEAIAYAPLMQQLSEQGITCVLMKMPFNLAVFDIKAADRVYGEFPQIENWYLMGHSLGGAMASTYSEKNYEKLSGLVLLAAYPVNDADVSSLTLYGSEDYVLDKSKLIAAKYKMIMIGANHAYFGNYGEQEGDGTALITREEQQELAVKLIMGFISDNTN